MTSISHQSLHSVVEVSRNIELRSLEHSKSYSIRPASPKDLAYLPDVERSAGQLFRSMPGLELLADDEPTSVDQHRSYLDEVASFGFGGGVLVAIPKVVASSDPSGEELDEIYEQPVAFIAATLHRCEATMSVMSSGFRCEAYFLHIHELSVHMDHQRRGLARCLLEVLYDRAAEFNRAKTPANAAECAKVIVCLTLTTFRDVPFNASFNRKWGFCDVPPEDVQRSFGIEADKIWNDEQNRFSAKNLAHRRCWMYLNMERYLS